MNKSVEYALYEINTMFSDDVEPWVDYHEEVAVQESPFASDPNYKHCSGCQEYYTLDNFFNMKHYADGKDYYCKACRNDMSIKSHSENSKKCTVDDCDRPHYALGGCRLHYERQRRTGTTAKKELKHEKLSHQLTIYKYNVDPEWYTENVKKGCMMCGESKQERKLGIDHDHECCKTGAADYVRSCGECVRGIVCNSCNIVLGHYDRGTIRKNNSKLHLAEAYIRKYEETKTKRK